MKITATASTGPKVILGDDSKGDFIDGFLPEQLRNCQQEVRPFRAAFSTFFERNNYCHLFPFTVIRQHADRKAAYRFVLTHAQSVPGECSITFEHVDIRLYLPDAIIGSPKCVLNTGVSTKFQYQIRGGQVLVNPS